MNFPRIHRRRVRKRADSPYSSGDIPKLRGFSHNGFSNYRYKSTLYLGFFCCLVLSYTILFRDEYVDPNKKCALLFFGLVKEFEQYVYPSIQANILVTNPHCDVYLHTYNMTSIPVNNRSQEQHETTLNISEALILTSPDRIVFESMDSFHEKRDEVIQRTRHNYHRGWGDCCTSHDNMIKQWNSINVVWDLMHQHEARLLTQQQQQQNQQESDEEKTHRSIDKAMDGNYYEQIGLFRSDVIYTKPIDIFNAKAAVPNFANHRGYNDRLFYGKYEYAKIWASRRFDFVDTFEQKHMVKISDSEKRKSLKNGYHSETFVKRLMDHYRVPIRKRDICVWRMRSGPRIRVLDCADMKEFSTIPGITKYLPKGLNVLAS
mmetsp:Transcript_21567/g.31813  ORF Transcript_21567/g.31813 Transcript_21567/m.31813 type:complete len:375 (-) Transcript_21567:2-1126(-)